MRAREAMSHPINSVGTMYYDSERKPRTPTSGYVAALREAHRYLPDVYALPLAQTLRTLSGEYQRAGNLPVARRHMNAALRVMRAAIAERQIKPRGRSEIVGLLWSSCLLWIWQGERERAAAAMAAALEWDHILWNAHPGRWGCRDMQRAKMLNIWAGLLWELGNREEAYAARADAILTALRCNQCEPEEVLALVGSFSVTVGV